MQTTVFLLIILPLAVLCAVYALIGLVFEPSQMISTADLWIVIVSEIFGWGMVAYAIYQWFGLLKEVRLGSDGT